MFLQIFCYRMSKKLCLKPPSFYRESTIFFSAKFFRFREAVFNRKADIEYQRDSAGFPTHLDREFLTNGYKMQGKCWQMVPKVNVRFMRRRYPSYVFGTLFKHINRTMPMLICSEDKQATILIARLTRKIRQTIQGRKSQEGLLDRMTFKTVLRRLLI